MTDDPKPDEETTDDPAITEDDGADDDADAESPKSDPVEEDK